VEEKKEETPILQPKVFPAHVVPVTPTPEQEEKKEETTEEVKEEEKKEVSYVEACKSASPDVEACKSTSPDVEASKSTSPDVAVPQAEKKNVVEPSPTSTPSVDSAATPSAEGTDAKQPSPTPADVSKLRKYTTSQMMALRDKSPSLEPAIKERIIRILSKPGKMDSNRRVVGGSHRNPKPPIFIHYPLSPFEAVKHQITSILNRLVEKNSKAITEELVKIHYHEDIALYNELASLIFEKAVQETMFVSVFAEVCKHLNETLKLPPQEGKAVSFKSLLLKKCQELFRKGHVNLEETEKKDLTDEEVERLEEKMYKKKKMFLGVIVFTTELYKQFLVPTVVVIDGCIKPLLKRIFTKEFSFVEPLSKLLMNVGEQLETDSKYKDILDSIYDSLSEIKKDPEMSKRDQFMIQDILELREGWRRAARRSKMTSSKPPAPVVRTITLTPPKAANIDSVRQLIISTLDEFMSSNDREAAFDYFRREVTSTTFGYVLMPQMIRYIFNNALPEKDVEKIASLLCDYPEFKRSDPKVFDQAMDDLLEVLADVEDATDKVISSFAVFMSMILKHLNYSITQSFIGCLTKLLDYDPFCSSKEKKRFGVPALYFVSTLSMVRKLDLEGEIVMKSKAEGYEKLFLSDEDRKALFEMYGI